MHPPETTATLADSIRFGADATPPARSSIEEVERTVTRLAESARGFARAPLSKKIAALAEVQARLRRHGHELARKGCLAKGLSASGASFGAELLAGAVITHRYVRLLREALTDVKERGAPVVSDDRVTRLSNGAVEVEALPNSLADRAVFMPYRIAVRLEAGVAAKRVAIPPASVFPVGPSAGALSVVVRPRCRCHRTPVV